MNVQQLREALSSMPGHWPVHLAVVSEDASGGALDEDFLFTLECVPESFPSQGCMCVIRANYDPS